MNSLDRIFSKDWQPMPVYQKKQIAKPIRAWLFKKASFTKALRQHTARPVVVEVIRECHGRPTKKERDLLKLSLREVALIREVRLSVDQKTYLYARSIIPESVLHGQFKKLSRLKQKALGDVLFRFPFIHRDICDIANIKGNSLWQGEAFGRRSIFHVGKAKMLVSECLLPELWQ